MPEGALATEGMEEFPLVRDFAIIMAVAGGVVVLFRKLNQPPILGYLLAGLIIGPFTLPDPPIKDVESIRLLGDLGLVLLLFALGMEFGWRRIRQVGLSVLLIGSVEIFGMISLGYGVGKALGWTSQEAFFLGAALSISSSTILVKVLRDSGRLATASGRLIVGILVVEDFAAVILLTLLSGVASTGTTGVEDVGRLVMKLAIFAVAALALGAVFVPRIIRFVSQFNSRETMLLATLALCFSLALVGQSLGVSAAAGAFLIGAVVGDTEESEYVTGIMEPVRDMFGAVFFVSIGMLIDVHLIKDHLVSAAVVSLVFIAGKVLANTVAAFVAGQPGRTPVQVGMGMPQSGEFSLAMMKVGVEQQAIGAFMYQMFAGVTAITSLFYPYISRSSDRVGDLLERRSPAFLRRSVTSVSVGFQTFRSGVNFDNEFARRIRRAAFPVGINLLIIVVILATGSFLAGFAPKIADAVGAPHSIMGPVIGFGALMLCVPAVVALWRSLRRVADEVTSELILRNRLFRNWVRESLRNLVRDALLLFFVVLVALWSLPLISELLSLGSLAAPVPLVVLVVLAIVAVRTLTDMHRQLVNIFNRTFLGGPVELSSFANGAPVGQVPTAQTARVGTAAAEDPAEDSAVGPAAHTRNLDASARGRRFWQPRTWPRPRSRTAMVALFSSCALLLLALGWTMGYWLSSWSEWWFLAD